MKIIEKPITPNSLCTKLVYELEGGERFGNLVTVKKSIKKAPNGVQLWETKCDCGNTTFSRPGDLMNGAKKSCGCFQSQKRIENGQFRLIDMAGQKYAMLSILSRAENPYGGKDAFWKCLCDCGNYFIGCGLEIRTGRTKSCGCKRSGVDLTGKQFSEWTVISRDEAPINGRTRWICECSCGTYRAITSDSLLRGKSKSCGSSIHFSVAGEKFGEWKVLKKSSAKDYWLCRCSCGKFKDVHISSLRSGNSKSCGCTTRTTLQQSVHLDEKLIGISKFEGISENELIQQWTTKERPENTFGGTSNRDLLDFIHGVVTKLKIHKDFFFDYKELTNELFVSLKLELTATEKYAFGKQYYIDYCIYIAKKYIREQNLLIQRKSCRKIILARSINERCLESFGHFIRNLDYLWNSEVIQTRYHGSYIYAFDLPTNIRSHSNASPDLDLTSRAYTQMLTSIQYHDPICRPIGGRFTSVRHLKEGVFNIHYSGILFVNPNGYRDHHESFIEKIWQKKTGLSPIFVRRYSFEQTEAVKKTLEGKLKKIKEDIPFFIWNQLRGKKAYSISNELRKIKAFDCFPAQIQKFEY
jgi:hypothetical protein